jgi:hypothetical protein
MWTKRHMIRAGKEVKVQFLPKCSRVMCALLPWLGKTCFAVLVLSLFLARSLSLGFFFFLFCGTRVWTQSLHLEPLHQPYFCDEFFRDRISRTICLGWLWTVILLISASWVARITGVSHRCLAKFRCFLENRKKPNHFASTYFLCKQSEWWEMRDCTPQGKVKVKVRSEGQISRRCGASG